MLAEMISKLVDLGQRASMSTKVDLPDNKVMLVHSDGQHEVIDGPRPVVNTKVENVPSLVEWVKAVCDGTDVFIHVSGSAIDAIIDPMGQKKPHSCSLEFEHTAQFDVLQSWTNSRGIVVSQAVRKLRGPLAGTTDPSFLHVLRRMKFSVGQNSQKQVSHKGESMGRSIDQQAESYDGDIPETVLFTLPIFRGLPVDMSMLDCAITVNPSEETIYLGYIGDAYADAERSIIHQLIEKLKSDLPTAVVLAAI